MANLPVKTLGSGLKTQAELQQESAGESAQIPVNHPANPARAPPRPAPAYHDIHLRESSCAQSMTATARSEQRNIILGFQTGSPLCLPGHDLKHMGQILVPGRRRQPGQLFSHIRNIRGHFGLGAFAFLRPICAFVSGHWIKTSRRNTGKAPYLCAATDTFGKVGGL
jgi:hypothetical protein